MLIVTLHLKISELEVGKKPPEELAEEYVGYMNQMAADFNLTLLSN